MYKNKRYRSSKSAVAAQAKANAEKTKSVLSPIVENCPTKQRKVQVDDPKKNRKGAPPEQHEDEEMGLMSSQGSIPASQPPTQRRYLSQRSTICRTQSKAMSRAPNSYFEMVLMKAGAEIDEPDSYLLTCDHIAFVNRFRNQLSTHPDFPQNIKTFIEGLQDAMESLSTTVKLMSGCTINLAESETTLQSQDSMMMNFLMVEFLQEDLIKIITEKLMALAKDDKSLNGDPPLLPLMLSQLKFVAPIHGQLLYDKITDIYNQAVIRAKREIVSQAEYVLSPYHHDDFVEFLINSTVSNKELLNPQTVHTFTNMYLSAKVQTKIRNKILNFIKSGCETSLFPIFTKFLLKPGCEDDDVLPNLIKDLRSSLKFRPEETGNDAKKIELDTFINIKQALTRSKKVFDTWQKVIQNIPGNEIRPIDFVVLLMLMSIREEKYSYLENLARRRIKLEHFTVSILHDVCKELPAIFDQHAGVFITMLHGFLREKHHLITSFAKSCYKIVFIVNDGYQKKILLNLVEMACDKSSPESTTLALQMLKDLNMLYSKEMQNCGMLLLPLLDRTSDFTLNQYRTLMELLCLIAYPPPPLTECPMLQDHIDMLVKKQIISRTTLIKKQGIIGMVQLINHIIRTEETDSNEEIYDLNESYNTVDELPDGRGKIAGNYIGRIFASTVYMANTLALFYDEMAAICSPCNSNKSKGLKSIDRHFLIWFSDLATNYFQNFFVVEEAPAGFKPEMIYDNCINVPEEDASVDSELIPIAINLGGNCFKLQADSASSITVLPPLFNLVRTLHFIRYGGNLESINALLGCATIIPKLPAPIDDMDIFDEYDETTATKIVNTHFYLVNWYREVISAFASQDQQMIRKKILLRLAALIEMEIIIQRISSKFPADYVPPLCNFISDIQTDKLFKKPTGRAKKAVKSKPSTHDKTINPETEGMSILATAKTQNTSAAGRCSKTNKILVDESLGKGVVYRQLDPDIILILREKLNTTYPIPAEEVGTCIGLLEFKFIICDLVYKLESIPGIKQFSNDQPMQFVNYPVDLIKDVVRFIPKLMEHFKQLSEKLKKSLEVVKGALGNADLFTEEMNFAKICFGNCLRLFAALFSWSGFDEATEKDTLKEALKGINNYSLFATTPDKRIEELAELAFKKFLAIEQHVIDIKSAVHLYHMILSVKRFTKDLDTLKPIRSLCKSFLCRKWYGLNGIIEKGAQCNVLLNELLIGFMSNSDYKRMKTVLKLVIDEVGFLKKRDDCIKMFPNIHKANFPMLFRCLCESFINVVHESISEYRSTNMLKKWEQSCEVQNLLLDIVKSLDIPRNFTLFLKHAHVFVKAFLQNGLPAFENGLTRDPERANELLKSLQVTTRFLHNLCCHSKAIRNTAIVAQIPAVRQTIEDLVYRVKAALAANNCSSVFFMGNLKNKDLQGDVIQSQTSSLTGTNDGNESEEEQLPDDSCVDESVLNEDEIRGDNNRSRPSRDNSRSTCF